MIETLSEVVLGGGAEPEARVVPRVAFEHHDAVRAADRGETVGDNDRRASFHEVFERLLNGTLTFCVERAGCLVQQQDRRILEYCPRDRYPLSLPAGEARAALAEKCLVALGQPLDELVGFGSYHYVYASGRGGDWMLTGFSPRKQALTVYIMSGFTGSDALLKKLGKYKTGKSCLYINKLEDIDHEVLRELVSRSVDFIRTNTRSGTAEWRTG